MKDGSFSMNIKAPFFSWSLDALVVVSKSELLSLMIGESVLSGGRTTGTNWS